MILIIYTLFNLISSNALTWSADLPTKAGTSLIQEFQASLPQDINYLDEAVKKGRADIIQAAIQSNSTSRPTKGMDFSEPVIAAAEQGNAEFIKAFYAHPHLGNAFPEILLTAAKTGKTKAVETLLSAGANKNAKNKKLKTALHFASSEGHLAIVELLLKSGADKDAQDSTGNTPLHYAAEEDQNAIAELLLKSGADKDSKNVFGLTPLHLASRFGMARAAEVLIKYKADPKITDGHGKTPLNYAIENNHPEIVAFINSPSAAK